MSDKGFFLVDRDVFDHPGFAPEPFTEREAWLWMISAAAWSGKKVRIGRAVIDLERGQLAFTLRYLATKFKWSESRLRRFLMRRTGDAAITTLATREATQVTICNYDKYQRQLHTGDAQSDAPIDARSTQNKTSKQVNKETSSKNNNSIVSDQNLTQVGWQEEFQELWRLYPRKTARAKALQSFRKAIAKTTLEVIRVGIETYIRHKPEYQDWCHFSTWLNQERWNDQYPDTNVVPLAKPLTPYQQNQADRKKVLDELAKFAYGDNPAQQAKPKNGSPLGPSDDPTLPFGRLYGA